MAKDKIQKTNVARLLERAGIHFELIPYEVDENDLAAQHVADQLGEDISRVFKTLVLKGEYPGRNSAASNAAGHFVCVVPGDAEVDFEKGSPCRRRQKSRSYPHEGTASAHRLHTRRMLPRWE